MPLEGQPTSTLPELRLTDSLNVYSVESHHDQPQNTRVHNVSSCDWQFFLGVLSGTQEKFRMQRKPSKYVL